MFFLFGGGEWGGLNCVNIERENGLRMVICKKNGVVDANCVNAAKVATE